MSHFIKEEADLLFIHIVAVTFRRAGIQKSQEMHEVLPSCSQTFVRIYLTVVADAVCICVTISLFVLKIYFCFVCLILAFFFLKRISWMLIGPCAQALVYMKQTRWGKPLYFQLLPWNFDYAAWKLTAYIVVHFFCQGISPSHCREIRLFNNYFDHVLCSKRFCSCFTTKLKHCKPLNLKLCMRSWNFMKTGTGPEKPILE